MVRCAWHKTTLFLDGARLDPRESKDQMEQTCCV